MGDIALDKDQFSYEKYKHSLYTKELSTVQNHLTPHTQTSPDINPVKDSSINSKELKRKHRRRRKHQRKPKNQQEKNRRRWVFIIF